jgi:hypothetical protein
MVITLLFKITKIQKDEWLTNVYKNNSKTHCAMMFCQPHVSVARWRYLWPPHFGKSIVRQTQRQSRTVACLLHAVKTRVLVGGESQNAEQKKKLENCFLVDKLPRTEQKKKQIKPQINGNDAHSK